MAVYTNIPKPTGTSYTNINLVGRTLYDESTIAYDDSSTFYDGINQNLYTNISKPDGYGQLQWGQMTMQWQDADQQWGQVDAGYTKIPKPI